jgi:hypothetical protein
MLRARVKGRGEVKKKQGIGQDIRQGIVEIIPQSRSLEQS